VIKKIGVLLILTMILSGCSINNIKTKDNEENQDEKTKVEEKIEKKEKRYNEYIGIINSFDINKSIDELSKEVAVKYGKKYLSNGRLYNIIIEQIYQKQLMNNQEVSIEEISDYIDRNGKNIKNINIEEGKVIGISITDAYRQIKTIELIYNDKVTGVQSIDIIGTSLPYDINGISALEGKTIKIISFTDSHFTDSEIYTLYRFV